MKKDHVAKKLATLVKDYFEEKMTEKRRTVCIDFVQGGFFYWSAQKNESVRLHVDPFRKVLSVRIS